MLWNTTLRDEFDKEKINGDYNHAVQDAKGDKVLFLFEEEDDAERYAMQLEEQEDNEMEVVEVDSDLAIKTCKLYNYKYTVITNQDIVIPPNNDKLQKD